MSAVVFVGPTLSSEEAARSLPDADIRGPAACGDLYRATTSGATALILIDGYFDQRLPVWHKEVLWALSRGVLVYGGASMGALRAAELHRFGMIGVGRVFDWYVSGELEADDEVAVAHEAEDRGYRAVSEAMVNLRATFLAAESAGVVHADTRRRLIEIGRRLFYPSRTLGEVLARAARAGVNEAELAALREWLASDTGNVVDQKRIDARAVLERARADLAALRPGPSPNFSFEYTEVWHELTRHAATVAREPPPPERHETPESAIADQWTEQVIRLLDAREPELAGSLRRDAERRAALLERAQRASLEPEPGAVQGLANGLRQRRDLLTREHTQAWLSELGLDVAEFSEWMHEDWLVARASGLSAAATRRQLRRVIHASEDPNVLRAISDVNRTRVSNEQTEQATGAASAGRALSEA